MKLIQFSQNDCNPCTIASNFIEHELNTKADEIHYLFDGNEESTDLAIKYSVMQTPTFVLIDDEGEEIEKVLGANKPNIESIFKKRGLI